MFNWTIINNLPRGIANSTGVVGTESITMSPVMAETVTVEDPPVAFSPFSLADCTMLSHFSFNDFVAIAFLD